MQKQLTKHYDVAVCGGGVAGCAAALAAARRGFHTLLLEKTVFPGGLATSGVVLVYLPLCDGRGNQVSFGITEEFLRISNQYGPADIPEDWQRGTPNGTNRLMTYFSPASFVLALDELLQRAGVDVWYDSCLTDCRCQDRKIREIEVFNKSGKITISADLFIDASGDADLAFMAGNPCHCASNAMVSWIIEHREAGNSSSFTFGNHVSTRIMSSPISNEDTEKGINGKMVSEFLLEGRRRYRRELLADYGSGHETRQTRYPLVLPSMVPLRHTRCIEGDFMLESGMSERDFSDCIGLVPEWRGIGPSWAIPYRSLLPVNLDNVLAAGRCISARDDAWEITRVIPAAALTGEVAGVAAALALQKRVMPRVLPYEELAGELRRSSRFIFQFSELPVAQMSANAAAGD